MLVLENIICILALITLFLARREYNNNNSATRKGNILAIISGILDFIFCILLTVTNSTIYVIPKLFVFASIYIYILLKYKGKTCWFFWIFIVLALFSTGIILYSNLKKCDSPEVSTTTYNIVNNPENVSELVTYFKHTISTKDVYRYYYETNSGILKHGSIPVDSTTVYYVKPGEMPYLEKVITKHYYFNDSVIPLFHQYTSYTESYNLYVPKGSIIINNDNE